MTANKVDEVLIKCIGISILVEAIHELPLHDDKKAAEGLIKILRLELGLNQLERSLKTKDLSEMIFLICNHFKYYICIRITSL